MDTIVLEKQREVGIFHAVDSSFSAADGDFDRAADGEAASDCASVGWSPESSRAARAL